MKSAIVTGASGAIGREIVKTLALNGYRVTAQYNSNKNAIVSLIEELRNLNVKDAITLVQADFCEENSVKKVFEAHLNNYNGVDLLVNNAGVDHYGLAQDICYKDYDRIMNVNQKAPIALTALVLDKMIEQKSGNILFISSIWGSVGGSFESVYSASKSSLIGYSKALAKEVGPSNVRVNCICPGVIKSPMNDGYSKEEINQIIEKTPLQKIGEPSDVAKLVNFLASDISAFITGQTITIDGGFTL